MATTGGIAPIADPRVSLTVDEDPALNATAVSQPAEGQIKQRVWGLQARVDESVTFEEYRYWAATEREEERVNNELYVADRGPVTIEKIIQQRFSKGVHHEEKKKKQQEKEAAQAASAKNGEAASSDGDEKKGAVVAAAAPPSFDVEAVTPEDWKTAARALRTASWGTMFYLITTDILGWSSCPFVFASVGWGAGVALYLVFGVAAAFSGWMLWKVFLGLDSSRYPMVSFGDTFFRVYGKWPRHFINAAQALQQFMTVAVLILGYGQTIAQLSNESICYVACMIIFMAVGMVFGSIRSLQRLGWLANFSVWLNVVCFLIIMVASAKFGIDYEVVTRSTLIKTIEPVRTFAGTPPNAYMQQAYGFAGQFNGIDQLVYSYGGAILFIAFLSEMRHPMDFWKGMIMAQAFICIVYIFFGAFVYAQFGQYSIANIGNAIQPVSLQTVQNVLSMITAFIACILYFNIGMKTVYIEVFEQIFNFPPIASKKGRWFWYALGPVYWILAFVVAAAVPNLSGLSSLVGALLILNFTYTFPAMVYVGYRCQIGAALPGEGFDPVTGETTRLDGGWKRWVRGFTKNWGWNTVSVVYMLGGLVCSGMGSWAAVEGLISVFGPGGTVATSFGCAAPV